MDYEKFKNMLTPNEKGNIEVYVPDKSDSMTALQGALFEKLLQEQGMEMYDIKFKTYHDPTIRIGETDQEFNMRLIEFEDKMNEAAKDHIILGSERNNISVQDMTEMIQPWKSLDMKEIIQKINEDMEKPTEERSQLSQMIDSMNLTRKEIMGAKSDFNFWNTSNIMSSALDTRNEMVEMGEKIDSMSIQTSIEEDIYKNRYEIPVEIAQENDLVIISVPDNVANTHFPENNYGESQNDNTIIAMLDTKELKDIGIYEKIEPVIDMGGQEIYNAEGDNITMNIKELTDAWAKSQIHDAIQDAKPMSRANVEFKVVSLDHVGAFYEDIAKSAQDTNVVGYTYQQGSKFIFKPIEQKDFNIVIPEEWKEGNYPDEVEQVNKNGLSVTFKTEEQFQSGLDKILDEMGLEKETELEVDLYEKEENMDMEEPEIDEDEQEVEID